MVYILQLNLSVLFIESGIDTKQVVPIFFNNGAYNTHETGAFAVKMNIEWGRHLLICKGVCKLA